MGREWATGIREDGGIGMRIGGDRQTIQLKRADGTVVASVSRSVSKKSSKKKKRLQYNFKEISRQIMAAKTSVGAGSIAARARFEQSGKSGCCVYYESFNEEAP